MPLNYKDLFGNSQEEDLMGEMPISVTATPGADIAIDEAYRQSLPQEDPKKVVMDYLIKKNEEAKQEESSDPSKLDVAGYLKRKNLEDSLNKATDLISTTAGGIMTHSAPGAGGPSSSSGSSGMDPMKLMNYMQREDLGGQRLELAKRAAELAAKRAGQADVRMGEQEDQFQQKRRDAHNKQFGDFAKQVSGMGSSSRNAVGRAALVMQSSNAVKALAGDPSQWDSLTPQQMFELAKAFDRTVSQGNPTVSGTAHLVPSSALGNVAKFQQWLTNSPQGMQQGEFVKQMVKGAEREYQVSKKMRDDTIDAFAPGYVHLKDVDEDRFNKILSGGKNIYSEDSGPDVAVASKKAEENINKMAPKKSSIKDMQDGQIREVNGHTYVRQNGKWILQE